MTNRPAQPPHMPQSDRLVEQLYDLVNKIESERVRTDVARTALLAAEYKAAQLAKKEVPMSTKHQQKAAGPAGIIDQALARFGMACRDRARIDGDQQVVNYIDKATAAISPSTATAGGSLSDTEKPATKAVADPLGDMLSAAAASAGAASQAARDQSAALGMLDDLFGWRK